MLVEALIATNIVTAGGLALALYRLAIYRARRRQRNLLSRWPIPRVPAGDIAPILTAGPLGPMPASEIVAFPNYRVPGGISDLETWVLCNLARHARLIFEFGTATGKTTYLLARNAPADARVVTLTLDPRADRYREDAGDDARAKRAALAESLQEFTYRRTAAAAKITQLLGDSKAFDETPYAGRCDLVFVDASHARSYVESDSRKALGMVRPGGTVLWHDYAGPRHAPGVYDALNQLARELPLRHIEGTMLVAYRKPAASS
ncbi:MAG TPA: class I SAM-dependent methyltransferase [Stellaceae bacterium]